MVDSPRGKKPPDGRLGGFKRNESPCREFILGRPTQSQSLHLVTYSYKSSQIRFPVQLIGLYEFYRAFSFSSLMFQSFVYSIIRIMFSLKKHPYSTSHSAREVTSMAEFQTLGVKESVVLSGCRHSQA
jgi:hypothetical protein